MARASARAIDSTELKTHSDMAVRLGAYAYELQLKNGEALLSVSNGAETTIKNLEWAVGDGLFGQTYVYRAQGKFYESQLSFYSRLNGLGTTTGHMEPGNLETAAGGLTTPAMIRQCFGCHFTAATTSHVFDPEHSTGGVTCEGCHGPGLRHVRQKSGPKGSLGGGDDKPMIMNPAQLNPGDSVDFCGACHRTSADAVLSGLAGKGVIDVRIQPYRLEKSRCWGKGDARLTCIACHDPHVQVVSDPGFYDGKCLHCHLGGQKSGLSATRHAPACKTGTKDCVTCHMPRVEVPGTYTTFTDHWIRIAAKGSAYPD
jgi:hypothetical protein